MSPLYSIILILYSVIPSKGDHQFCNGADYIEFDQTLKPDTHGKSEGTFPTEEIEFHFYSNPGYSPYLGVVIYYRTGSSFHRMHDGRLCCFMSTTDLGNVVQRLDRDTLVYKLKDGSCYQVTYAYNVISGPHVKDSGYMSCKDVDICKPPIRVPSPSYIPYSTSPTAPVRASGYGSISARFLDNAPTGTIGGFTGTANSRFPLATSTSADSRFIAPTPSSSPTDRFRFSPPPSAVTYPTLSYNPLVEHGSDDFCKGTKNYIALDPSAEFGKFRDSITWGRFKLTLYFMVRYDSSVSGLEIKYFPDDFDNPREMSVGKYKVCCGITLSTIDKVLRLQGTSTLVFKLNEYSTKGALCNMIAYTYYSKYGVRELKPTENLGIPCLEVPDCIRKIN